VPTEPSISVVVTTYNRAHVLERVLNPLLNDPAASEVIVVIDGSQDSSLEVVERLAQRQRRLRSLPIANSGDMAAREAGAKAAKSEIVLFVDDDVIAAPGLVTGHARQHAGNSADVVVGYMPVKLARRRKPDDVATRLYAREYEGRCEIYEREPESALRELWGGNFSMRRADCLAVGMSNPEFTEPYHADRDFGIRCLEAGLSGVFDRSLGATHLHDRSLKAFIRDAQSQGAARVLMSRFHPDIIPPLDASEFVRSLPGPIPKLVHLSRRPRAHRALLAFLKALINTAGSSRLWPIQDYGARLLRRIEQQWGAIEQSYRRRRH
jgi:glycosyltransferase involved in cell wall biosynthesis